MAFKVQVGAAQLAQHVHDVFRHCLIRGLVDRQEHRLRAPPGRRAQRQPGVHAEFARLVGGGRHDSALRRVSVTADHHGPAAQLGPPQHLDSRDELIEVHMQDPAPRLSHASVSQPGRRTKLPGQVIRRACGDVIGADEQAASSRSADT